MCRLEWSPVRDVGESEGGVPSSMFQAEGPVSSAKECPARPHSLPFSSPSLDPDLDPGSEGALFFSSA